MIQLLFNSEMLLSKNMHSNYINYIKFSWPQTPQFYSREKRFLGLFFSREAFTNKTRLNGIIFRNFRNQRLPYYVTEFGQVYEVPCYLRLWRTVCMCQMKFHLECNWNHSLLHLVVLKRYCSFFLLIFL